MLIVSIIVPIICILISILGIFLINKFTIHRLIIDLEQDIETITKTIIIKYDKKMTIKDYSTLELQISVIHENIRRLKNKYFLSKKAKDRIIKFSAQTLKIDLKFMKMKPN